jgi:hypothetical protein
MLHEVMSLGIMVCVTLILKTFEYVHLIPFVSNGCLNLILIHLTMSRGNGHRIGQLFRGCTLPHGKNGLKGIKGKSSGREIKS